MNKINKWVFLILLSVILLILGYLKDFIFININTHLFYVKRNLEDLRSHTFFNFLNNFSFKTVYYLKYFLTAFFLSTYYFVSVLVLRILNKINLVKYLKIIYLVVIFISAAFFLGGFFLNQPETGYSVSRVFIGPLESPLPLIFLLLAARVNNIQQLQ